MALRMTCNTPNPAKNDSLTYHGTTHRSTMFSRPTSSKHDARSSVSLSVISQECKFLGCDCTNTKGRAGHVLVCVRFDGMTARIAVVPSAVERE